MTEWLHHSTSTSAYYKSVYHCLCGSEVAVACVERTLWSLIRRHLEKINHPVFLLSPVDYRAQGQPDRKYWHDGAERTELNHWHLFLSLPLLCLLGYCNWVRVLLWGKYCPFQKTLHEGQKGHWLVWRWCKSFNYLCHSMAKFLYVWCLWSRVMALVRM